MKNLLILGFLAGLTTMAACSSDDSSGGTGGSGTGGSGTGGSGTGGSATGGAAGAAGTASGGAAGTASGGAAGSTGDAGDPCVDCALAKCGNEAGACLGNPDCKAIYECVSGQTGDGGACTTQQCVDDCVKANPNGKTAWDALDNCLTTNCGTVCQ